MKQLDPEPQSVESIDMQTARIQAMLKDISEKLGSAIDEMKLRLQKLILRNKATIDDLNAALDGVMHSARSDDLVLTPPFPAGPLIPPSYQPFQRLWFTHFTRPELADPHFRIRHALKLYINTIEAAHSFLNSERGVATHTLLWAERFCCLSISHVITLPVKTRTEIFELVWMRLFSPSSDDEVGNALATISISHEAAHGYKLDDSAVFSAHKLLEDPLSNALHRRRAKKWSASSQPSAVVARMNEFKNSPDGEWIVLGLLFFRILHLKLGWHLPSQIRPKTKVMVHFYPGLMQLLNQCAFDATHPLAPTAAGLALTLSQFTPFYKKNNLIDPRDPQLPYDLQLDSLSSTQLSIETTKAWLKHLGMKHAVNWVDDVVTLAQDFASTYTDPYGHIAFKPHAPIELLESHCESLAAFGRTLNQISSGKVPRRNVPRFHFHPAYHSVMKNLLEHAMTLQAPLKWVIEKGWHKPHGYDCAR